MQSEPFHQPRSLYGSTSHETFSTVSTAFPTSSFNSTWLGYNYMFVSALSHAIMTFMIHLGARRYLFPSSFTILVRGLVECTFSTLWLLSSPTDKQHAANFPKSTWLFLLLRGLFAAGSVGGQVIALSFLPMGDCVTIFFTCPAITMVMCAMFLHEPMTLVGLISFFMSFVGVVLVAQPSFLHIPGTVHHDAYPRAHLGVLFASIAAFSTSSAVTVTRSFGRSVPSMYNVLSLSLYEVLLGLLLTSSKDWKLITNSYSGMAINIIAGFAGFISQATLSRGLQSCRAGPALLVRSLTIPCSFLLGLVFLRETASALTLGGVSLVIAAVAVMATKECVIRDLPITNGLRIEGQLTSEENEIF